MGGRELSKGQQEMEVFGEQELSWECATDLSHLQVIPVLFSDSNLFLTSILKLHIPSYS